MIYDYVDKLHFCEIRKIVDYYLKEISPDTPTILNLTKKQRVLYGLDIDENDVITSSYYKPDDKRAFNI